GDMALFRAFVVMGARLTMLLQSLAPPMAALIGWYFLGERLSLGGWIGMAITLVGITWVVSERTPHRSGELLHAPPRGLALAVIAAAGQAGGLVLSKRGLRLYSYPFAATQIRATAGIAGFFLLLLALG